MTWEKLQSEIVACERCPRLREHCVAVAERRKQVQKRFDGQTYWARPVPNFGGADARILFVGLAPGAHGANRTGRMFTGDDSGDFLYPLLYESGFASQSHAVSRDDGMQLIDCAITAAVHCAPPENKPDNVERANCAPFLEQTVSLMPNLRLMVAIGELAYVEIFRLARRLGWLVPRPQPKFAHAMELEFHAGDRNLTVLSTYHVSRYNQNTGVITEQLLRIVLKRARAICDESP